ncbi:uncharacterized protein LOC116302764 [Actinia tenebrosa]|uniref:Uncharacterized protein LOC116302764 n=1 Tax=Actinia tenebrosa TaxID=6105 RepID=A0A6P8ILX4_ACTTE|nr:uncharacterized protein LOC116302764 [Actinia tenebrosa]
MKENTSGEFAKMDDVDPAVLEYTVTKNMEYGKIYKFVVTAWNTLGESEYDDTMVKSITMTKKESGTKRPLGEKNSKCLTGVGVIAAILIASLVLNVLQFLFIWKKIRLNENRRNPDNERYTNQGNDDQVYDNAFELQQNSSSHAVLESKNPAPDYEAVQLQRGQQQKIRSKNLENSNSYEAPSATTQPSIYQSLSTTGPVPMNKKPVYETLRTGVPRNDNETNMYQPLGLRNQNSDYQTLHIDGSDSTI